MRVCCVTYARGGRRLESVNPFSNMPSWNAQPDPTLYAEGRVRKDSSAPNSSVRVWCKGRTRGLGPCGRGSIPRTLTNN